MAKRHAFVAALVLLAASAAFAGDVAQFVNLGFSADAKYFMFGQYGVSETTSAPWADTSIVDVEKNAFVAKGVRSFRATRPVDPGATALGALLNALDDGRAERAQYRVDHLNTGRLTYILLDGASAPTEIEFRDFITGRSYKVALTQAASTANGDVSSSYSITVTITEKNGTMKALTAGDSTFRRKGVGSYTLKQVILAPDGTSLVFVVQKQEKDGSGDNVRYMVETLRLK